MQSLGKLRTSRRQLFCLLSLFFVCSLIHADRALVSSASNVDSERIRRQPMGIVDLSPRLANLLRLYYKDSFGGAANWDALQSFRFEGVLQTPSGQVPFVAYKKKPHYCKVVLKIGKTQRVMYAYDGEDAWQMLLDSNGEAMDMPALEALNFIRDAPTGSHLLYPSVEGKQLEFYGLRSVEGEDCYRVLVRLDSKQLVEYYISRLTSRERRQIVYNAVNGQREVTTHFDFQTVAGVSIPFRSEMRVEGQLMHQILIRNVDVNIGIMSWMFQRRAAYLLPDDPNFEAIAADFELDLDVFSKVKIENFDQFSE